MAATKRQMNNRAVAFVVAGTGGASTTITGVTGVAVDPGGNALKFSGDGDRFMSLVVNDMSDPSVTVTAADIAALTANSVGTYGTLSFVSKDAKNQGATSSAGDITTAITGMIVNTPFNSPHRQIGTGTLTVTGTSADGLTSPMSLTVA